MGPAHYGGEQFCVTMTRGTKKDVIRDWNMRSLPRTR